MTDDKVVRLAAHRQSKLHQQTSTEDNLLEQEGIEILKAYRGIRNDKLRKTLRELVLQISQLDNEVRRAGLVD